MTRGRTNVNSMFAFYFTRPVGYNKLEKKSRDMAVILCYNKKVKKAAANSKAVVVGLQTHRYNGHGIIKQKLGGMDMHQTIAAWFADYGEQ